MKHLGDITKINGGEIEPVAVITFGSPCTRLSTAGRHDGFDLVFSCTGLGDTPHFVKTLRAVDKYRYAYEMSCPICGKALTATNESALFFHAVRIIEEMRNKTNGIYPAFAIWENVPGAFSSSKGEDFKTVLQELAWLCCKTAHVPRPTGGKWNGSGCIMGDGWSIAWRIFDAQFWGVPQRRRRIALVVDFTGERAPEILFERESLSGHIAQGKNQRQGTAAYLAHGAHPASTGQAAYGFQGQAGAKAGNIGYDTELAPTLETSKVPCLCLAGNAIDRAPKNGGNGIGWQAELAYTLTEADRHAVFECHGQDSRVTGPLAVSPTVTKKLGTGGGNVPMVFSFDSISSNSMKSANPNSGCRMVEVSRTLDTFNPDPSKNQGGIAIVQDIALLEGNVPITIAGDRANAEIGVNMCPTLLERHPPLVSVFATVRRLTPLECDRLQGYPDNWTDIGPWMDTKGKLHKESADATRYRADGNSIAIPVFTYVLQKMATYLPTGAKLGSLFDGIGGFPLIWERIHGKDTARWASEIEEFPIAVTKYRFGER